MPRCHQRGDGLEGRAGAGCFQHGVNFGSQGSVERQGNREKILLERKGEHRADNKHCPSLGRGKAAASL